MNIEHEGVINNRADTSKGEVFHGPDPFDAVVDCTELIGRIGGTFGPALIGTAMRASVALGVPIGLGSTQPAELVQPNNIAYSVEAGGGI